MSQHLISSIKRKQKAIHQYRIENDIINGALQFWTLGTFFHQIQDKDFFTNLFQYHNLSKAIHNISRDTDVPNLTSPSSIKIDCVNLDINPKYCYISHSINKHNLQKYMGKKGTLSFYVKSSIPGKFSVTFKNKDICYIAEYEIEECHQWEKKSITLSFDDSIENMQVLFILSANNKFRNNKDKWIEGNFLSSHNQINLCSSDLNVFWLAEIKLELGEKATEFINPDYFIESVRIGTFLSSLESRLKTIEEKQKILFQDLVIIKEMEIIKNIILKSKNYNEFRNDILNELLKE